MPSPWGGLSKVAQDVRQSLVRFPISILSALAGTTIFLLAFHSKVDRVSSIFDFRNGLVAMVGISVATLATLWGESRKLQRSVNLLITAALTLCLWLVALYWKQRNLTDVEFISRCLQLAVVVHLAIGYLPAAHLSQNGFWQYNRLLFRRMVVVGVYAAIIVIGLDCAVLGAHYLLDLKFKDTIYPDIFMVLFFAYHPCVVLGGIPQRLEEFEEHHEYPTEIAVVAKFILLPLVALYGVILYLYLGKILISWELPRGGVGYLVSTVSLLGILCFLLLEPAIVAAGSRLQRVRSIFYFLLFPLIFLLFLGLKVRIGNYGFTEHRYLLTVYGVWITCIAIYFLCSKVRNIKVIPASLGIITFLTLVGPWSAYELPAWLQFRSLQKALMAEGLWRDGRAVQGDKVPSGKSQEEISAQIKYLMSSSQRKNLLKLFLAEKEIETEMGEKTRSSTFDFTLSNRMNAILGFRPDSDISRNFYFSADYNDRYTGIPVKGYAVFLPSVTMNDKTATYHFESTGTLLHLFKEKKRVATFQLKTLIARAEALDNSRKRIELVSEGDGSAKLFLYALSVAIKTDQTTAINHVNGDVLLK